MSRSVSSSTLITPVAYMKLILHAAKYQTRSVTGLLLASNASENGALLIDDVLPLFHTPPLSPSIELALTHAELFVPSGVTLAGVYFAPELFEPRVNPGGAAALPTPQANTATKIAEKIKENGKGQAGTRILLLDSVRLGALGAPNSASTHTGLDVFESVNGRWTTTGALALQAGAAGAEEPIDFVVAQLKAIIKEDKQRGLSDFDDHLDDVQADWTNAEFTKNVLPTGK